MTRNLNFIIKANQDFIRHTESDIKENMPLLNSLFESISLEYIPLLNMMNRLEQDNISFCISMVLPPVLCNLLSDSVIKEKYVEWLDARNELGKNELKRCADNPEVEKIIRDTMEQNEQLKNDFTQKYNSDLIGAFAEKLKSGVLELLATSGTNLFMPHYADLKEIISAQIESGLHAFRQYFGIFPEGFWIPELGYTAGIEKLIRAYGFTYTIMDSRAFMFAEKIPEKGIFYPARAENSLVVFARDSQVDSEVFDEETGFVNNPLYRNEKSDIGFELSSDLLSVVLNGSKARFSTGYKYLNRNFTDSGKFVYNAEAAKKAALEDAEKFLSLKAEKLKKASEILSDSDFVTLVCTFDADRLFKGWHESIFWLEEILRNCQKFDLTASCCSKMVSNQYNLEKFSPYFSSSEGTGYGENFLSSKNCWMMRYSRKACERMIDLADRFPTDTGLKNRLLNLGAKELMIALSSNLAKMIDEEDCADLAEKRFKDSIDTFTSVFDSLGSNTVSTEWLTTLEAKDSIFPWMNYRIFSRKH